MSQEVIKTQNHDLSSIVRAIGSDLEHTQVRMIASANADMLFHYWKVGHFILYLLKKEGWENKVIDNLSKAIRSKYPDKKGYSTRRSYLYVSVRKGLSIRSTERNGWSAQNSHDRERFEPDKLNQLVQQPVAQLGEVSETFSAIYHCEIEQIKLCGFYSIKCAQNLSF